MTSSDLVYEPKQWLKTVEDLQAQNNDLKEALSLVLRRQQLNASLLRQLDSFHTQLLDIDAAIALLRHDVAVQQRSSHPGAATAAGPKQPQLRRELGAMAANMAAMSRRLEGLKEEVGRPCNVVN